MKLVVSKQGSCFIYQYILDTQNALARRTNEIECSIGSDVSNPIESNDNPSPPAGKSIHYHFVLFSATYIPKIGCPIWGSRLGVDSYDEL